MYQPEGLRLFDSTGGHEHAATGSGTAFQPSDLLRLHLDLPAIATFEFNPAFLAVPAVIGVWNPEACTAGLDSLPVKFRNVSLKYYCEASVFHLMLCFATTFSSLDFT